jgi:hypothetical protein
MYLFSIADLRLAWVARVGFHAVIVVRSNEAEMIMLLSVWQKSCTNTSTERTSEDLK